MTALQAAKTYCCNYHNNTCVGVTIDDDLRLVRFRKENSRCSLSEPMERCIHFEQTVIPYRPGSRDLRTEARLQSELASAIHEYKIRTGARDTSSLKPCPECRNTIPKGRRICDACKDKNRRETQAKADRRRSRSQTPTVS